VCTVATDGSGTPTQIPLPAEVQFPYQVCIDATGKLVAFDASLPAENMGIYTAPADGSGLPLLISQQGGSFVRPSLSGDGRKVAWSASSQGTFVANTDGSGTPVVLAHSSGWTSLNWDGTRIALSSGGVDGELLVGSSDGTGPWVEVSTGFILCPQLSGDGSRVVWCTQNPYQAWVADVGGSARCVSAAGAFPALTADGAKIAYYEDGEVYVVSADGTGTAVNVSQDAVAYDWLPSFQGNRVSFFIP